MVRCLVVDDSPSFRKLMREILGKAPDVEIVGEAGDADSAVRLTVALRPTVVTMDVQMPGRNGIEAVAEIMNVAPTPVIVVCSGASDESRGIGFQALQAGALEVLEKPQATTPAKFAAQSEAIRLAVRAVATLRNPFRGQGQNAPTAAALPTQEQARGIKCVGIVTSTGGPPALLKVLSALPKNFPAPILIVQHLSDGFVGALAAWLKKASQLDVRVAKDGEALTPGTVLIAPDGAHLMCSLGKVRLDQGPPVRGFRPSGTVMLASLAREFGPSAAGVVLTGMGDDGSVGLRLMRERGGFTVAQGPHSSAIYGMPRVALETGAAERSIELDAIASTLKRAVESTDGGQKQAEVQSKPAESATKVAAKKLLLLVDDTETILQIEKRILEGKYDLVLARDGEEAVRTAAKVRPQGIVMDYSMPKMNGGQAMRALKVDPATSNIPVIVVTSETAPSILAECTDAGCKAILKKPIDAAQLIDAVARMTPP